MRKAPYLFMLLGGLFFAACDTLDQDTAPVAPESLQLAPEDKSIFISPGGEAIIDLRNSLKLRSNATLEVGAQPQKGSLEFLESGLLKYAAGKDFTSGNDSFIIKILKESTVLGQDTIWVVVPASSAEYPCYTGAVGDKISIHPDSLAGGSAFYNIRKNDLMCDSSAYKLSLYLNPSYGKAEIIGNYLQYIPGPDFRGYDKLMYQLCETYSSENYIRCTYAEVSIQAGRKTDCTVPADAADDYQLIWSDSARTDSTHYRKLINVVNNDFYCPGLGKLNISKAPGVGEAYFKDPDLANPNYRDSILYYFYPKDFKGTDTLRYTLCQDGLGCDEATVYLEIK